MNPNIITAVSTGQDIWGLLAVILLYLLAIIFLMFLVHIVVAYFLYKDAQQHGMSGGLWAIVVVLLPFLFFVDIVVYLIAVLIVACAYAIARNRNHGFRKVRNDED